MKKTLALVLICIFNIQLFADEYIPDQNIIENSYEAQILDKNNTIDADLEIIENQAKTDLKVDSVSSSELDSEIRQNNIKELDMAKLQQIRAEEARVIPNYQSGRIRSSGNQGIIIADGSTQSKAIGHYKRARQLIMMALNEFDRGVATANPDSLIDSMEWKSRLSNLADDLTIVINPQPRVTKEGVMNDASIKIFDNLQR